MCRGERHTHSIFLYHPCVRLHNIIMHKATYNVMVRSPSPSPINTDWFHDTNHASFVNATYRIARYSAEFKKESLHLPFEIEKCMIYSKTAHGRPFLRLHPQSDLLHPQFARVQTRQPSAGRVRKGSPRRRTLQESTRALETRIRARVSRCR